MSGDEDEEVNRREVAYRLFAAEFEDSDFSYSESDDDRSPNYVVSPTGARVNRLFAVGVLTEVEAVSDDVLRGRIVDPTGAFVAYAGQYQPDEQAFLERVETPTFVAVTGKARTFQPEDSDQVFTSIRPENFNEVNAETRDRWTVQTAEQTLDRVGHIGAALRLGLTGDELRQTLLDDGIDESLAAGIPLALDHYGTTPTYLDALRDLALDALGVVAGKRDEVGELSTTPDQTGPVTARDIPAIDLADHAKSADSAVEGSSSVTTDVESATEGSEMTDASSEVTTDSSEVASESTAESVDTSPESVDTSAEPTTPATTNGSQDETGESTEQESVSESGDDLGDFDPEEFELEEQTREQVKEEHGVQFQTGTEVEEPGEVDIDTPDPETEPTDTPEAETEDTEPVSESASSGTDQQSDTPQTDEEPDTPQTDEKLAQTDEESAKADGESDTSQTDDSGAERPEDVQTAVVELMGELDDGEGAQRAEILAEMESRYGIGEDETEGAIEEALMGGECYEPGDGQYKPI
jgi:RPA family protein